MDGTALDTSVIVPALLGWHEHHGLALPVVRDALADTQQRRDRDEITLPSTLGRERLINPFLRSREPAVRAAAERHAGHPLPEAVDVFTEVRRWKDGFR